MRPIGHLESEEQARTFADYLFVRGIEAQVEPAKNGAFAVWVVDEDRVDEGQGLLSRFRSMPDADEFHGAPAAAAIRRREEAPEVRAEAARREPPRTFARPMQGGGLTMVLLVLCVAVALATEWGDKAAWTGWLTISMEKISQGQLWRLFTPVLMHFTLWHLIVNLLWMQDLGGALEAKIGTRRFAAVVAGVALASNLAQYAAGGAAFSGMNGVVYGLFGYLWARGKRDPRFDVFISPLTSGLLLVFLALGIFGLVGATANAAHFSGLLAGVALGWLAAGRGAGRA